MKTGNGAICSFNPFQSRKILLPTKRIERDGGGDSRSAFSKASIDSANRTFATGFSCASTPDPTGITGNTGNTSNNSTHNARLFITISLLAFSLIN